MKIFESPSRDERSTSKQTRFCRPRGDFGFFYHRNPVRQPPDWAIVREGAKDCEGVELRPVVGHSPWPSFPSVLSASSAVQNFGCSCAALDNPRFTPIYRLPQLP